MAELLDPAPTGVVVGFDGSEPARLALRWAVEEALLRGLPLDVVHAWSLLTAARLVDAPPGIAPSLTECEDAARAWVQAAVDEALDEALAGLAAAAATASAPTVAVRLVHAHPAPVLVEASRTARLVVVGRRGVEGFAGLLLGSVAEKVARHAACPVLLVHEADPHR